MISTNFESRVKINEIVSNQIPEFILDQNPKFSEFLKQYYISQEFEGGPVDIVENLDQYLSFHYLNEKLYNNNITISSDITSSDDTITLSTTRGFPKSYGLLQIDDEVITYTGISGNSLTGCVRGFSGITSLESVDDPEELVFSSTSSAAHTAGSSVKNLNLLFLENFFKKLKQIYAPGFEEFDFTSELNTNTFISKVKSFYQTKGTEESIKILFKILYDINPKIINPEDYLIKPSDAEYLRRKIVVCDLLTTGGNPFKLVGQQIKSFDGTFSGPVSKVDISTKNNKTVYKIHLFYGYGDDDLIDGNFRITPKTKSLEPINVGDTTITVDSTIGFPKSGTIVVEGNEVTYTDKSVNQFYNCTSVVDNISSNKNVYQKDSTVYGFEDGDSSKRIDFIVIGSLVTIDGIDDFTLLSDTDIVELGELGDDIRNDIVDKTIKEYSFGALKYNVKTSYDILNFNIGSAELVLYEEPDKNSLNENEIVDILLKDTETVILNDVQVNSIIGRTVTIDTPITGILPQQNIAIRRNLNFANSTKVQIKHENVLSDVQNAYSYEDDLYIASNSLPSRDITLDVKKVSKTITSSLDADQFFDGFSAQKYTILSFENEVPFLTGDAVKYFHTTENSISELPNFELFYVEVLEPKNKIRLYSALSFLPVSDFLKFDKNTELGTHTFVLEQHASQIIEPSNSLKKIPLERSFSLSEKEYKTESGVIGVLANGVDIINYKSDDKVFFGPLDSLNVSNQGFGYDVINPPDAELSSPNYNVGVGTTAKMNLVVSGSFEDVFVDPQQFGVSRIITIYAKGGNGKNAVFEPITKKQYRTIIFNAADIEFGGSVDPNNDSFIFNSSHGLTSGEKIVYNTNENLGIGIGPFNGSNLDSGGTLVNGGIYYPEVINSNSIRLYNTISDLNSGINTVGLTTINNYGTHKFRVFEPINVLSYVRVVNPGENYTNRVLNISPSGIHTAGDTFVFENHGFTDGDLLNYSYNDTGIVGLDTSKKYYVLKLNDNSFQLADGGQKNDDESELSKQNYKKRKNITISSSGQGYQTFSYPPISVEVVAEYTGIVSSITLTPKVRGKVIDAYLYEKGTEYGSTALNLNIKPTVSIKTGSGAQLKPLVVGNKVLSVQVQNKGENYSSSVDLEVVGKGIGCVLRAVVVNGQIDSVIVINSGTGYDDSTSITISTPGQGAVIIPTIRSLTVNDFYRYPGDFYLENKEKNALTYGINGYFSSREGLEFDDPNPDTNHSRIIGWAKDGNPIYGPNGHTDPTSFTSPIKRLETGYVLDPSNIFNRPSTDILPSGFFVEDYKFNDSGDLDRHNGRFTETPEFPNGIYAYFASTKLDIATSAQTEIVPEFPYFVGNTYRSTPIDTFTLDQNDDLDSANLLRNTSPYRVNRENSSNYYIPKNFGTRQRCDIKSVESGSVDRLVIDNAGDGYSVGDTLIFNETNTDGSGVSAEIVEVKNSAEIENIQTSYILNENVIFIWENSSTIKGYILPSHNLVDNDRIEITGISTSSVDFLNGNHKISVESEKVILTNNISSGDVGDVVDLQVDKIPTTTSIGSSVSTGGENFTILNVYNQENVLRCKRHSAGLAHTVSDIISIIPSQFTFNLNSNYFESSLSPVYNFNPNDSIGIGTEDGSYSSTTLTYGGVSKEVELKTLSIYLPNHPFNTNDKVRFKLSDEAGASALLVSNESNGSQFSLPYNPVTDNTQDLFIIKKSDDYIGIVTQVGLTTTSSGLFFNGNGSDFDDYKFEKLEEESVTGTSTKITTTITTNLNHNILDNDLLSLKVIPNNTSGGITTSSSLVFKYNPDFNKLVTNPVGFSSLSVNLDENTIEINSHQYVNGDKILYTTDNFVTGGIGTGIYFVNKYDSNKIRLCDTYQDSVSNPANPISIGNSGSNSQEISNVNPKIRGVKNGTLRFDLSNSSLSGYEFNIFSDKQFTKPYVSTGSTSTFNVRVSGTPGTDGIIDVKYDNNLPDLYYSLLKDTKPVFENENEDDYHIIFVDSFYNKDQYVVSNSSGTTFDISLSSIPESLSYTKNQADISYSTSSRNTTGPISKINLLNRGSGYTSLPRFTGISTANSGRVSGINAIVSVETDTIGKFKSIEILNDGFDYASDSTLRPSSNFNTLLLLSDNEEITDINVVFGGKNYISKPSLVLVDTLSRKEVDTGILEVGMNNSSIGSISVITPPNGLKSSTHRLFTTNNTNGVVITGITTVENGIVHAKVRTPPIFGFKESPFVSGDKVFVEGVVRGTSVDEFGNETIPGDGYNSADHGYVFFDVTDFINDPGNAVLKYDISQYTTNPGIPQTLNSYATGVNEKNYPTFETIQVISSFQQGEIIKVNGVSENITVKNVFPNSLKVSSTNNIEKFNSIQGSISNSKALVVGSFDYSGKFKFNSLSNASLGWYKDTGKLNFDTQALPDNDYYQTLSYSIKSDVEYDKFIEPLSKLAHPIGTKNFGEVGFTSSSSTGIAGTSSLSTVLSLDEESRVDIIRNFDLVFDDDSLSNSTSLIKLRNKKLSNFIECRTNRVLQIDDISNSFSSSEINKDEIVVAESYQVTDYYSQFLIQTFNEINDFNSQKEYQLSNVVVLNDFENTYTLTKGNIFTGEEKLGDFEGSINNIGSPELIFKPTDPFNTNYNLKLYREYFGPESSVGFGVTDHGFMRIFSEAKTIESTVGFVTSIFRANASTYRTIRSSNLIINTDDYSFNYYEVFGIYDGVNTPQVSEYYFDSKAQLSGLSSGFLGTFDLEVDSGNIFLNFTNTSGNNITIKSKTVAIGDVSLGIGTYRFLSDDQIPETEKSSRIESKFDTITGNTIIKTLDSSVDSALKSLIRISTTANSGIGETISLYEVSLIGDQTNTSLVASPFVATGSNGIGTFGALNSGTDINLYFYPDPDFINESLLIQSVDQILYAENDEFNVPNTLEVGASKHDVSVAKYGSINVFGKDRLNFDMNWNRTPIFAKTINPKKSGILQNETGIINIQRHFFEDGEELIYTPGSTLTGVAATAISIGSTIVGGAIFTADIISGFSTVTGIGNTEGIISGSDTSLLGLNIPSGTSITSIGKTYSYFVGTSDGVNNHILGIANTSILTTGSEVFTLDNISRGTINTIGINSLSITSSNTLPSGTDVVYYSDDLSNSVEISKVSTGTTFRESYQVGIETNICPSKVFAIKINEDQFKITGMKNSGIGFTFTGTGSGNTHVFEMKKKNEKTVLTINGVLQAPLAFTPIQKTIDQNVSIGASFIALSGISSISPEDILKINDEYVTINSVGIGSTTDGPISGTGSFNLCNIERGRMGSVAAEHAVNDSVRVYKGSYNVVGNEIFFSEAPDGKGNNAEFGETLLPLPKSTFNGRVYLKQDYSSNKIYDDISPGFNGIEQVFTLYQNGEVVSDAVPGNNILTINNIFQNPDNDSSTSENYEILTNDGISSVRFKGVEIEGSEYSFTTEYDINQNDLPRGGIIVSMGFTGGTGYAPLVGLPGDMIDVTVDAGVITNVGFTTSIIVGLAVTGVIAANTTSITGIDTTSMKIGQKIMNILNEYVDEIDFVPQHVNLKVPNEDSILQFDTLIQSIGTNSITLSKATTNTSSLTTSFGVDFGEEFKGSGYNSDQIVAIYEDNHTGTPAVVKAIVSTASSSLTPTNVTYDPATGDSQFTFGGAHNLSNGDEIRIMDQSIVFTCAMDNYKTEHVNPQSHHYSSGRRLPVTVDGPEQFTVNVGASGPNQQFTPTNAVYNPATGDLILTIGSHTLSPGEGITIDDNSLTFTCTMDNNQSEKTYPRPGIDPYAGRSIPIKSVTSNSITIYAGISRENVYFTPSAATYDSSSQNLTLTIGSHGLGEQRNVVLSDNALAFQKANNDIINYPDPNNGSQSGQSITIVDVPYTSHTPTDAPYNASTGIVTFEVNGHGLESGNYIMVEDGSLTYTCDLDDNTVQKSYPRAGYDYPSNRWLIVTVVDANHFTVDIGPSSDTSDHTFVSASTNALRFQGNTIVINASDLPSETLTLTGTPLTDSVKHEPQSLHTFVPGVENTNAVKHLPQSTHSFVRATEGAILLGCSGGQIESFEVISGGSGYTNPQAALTDPSYDNLKHIGIFRPSVGGFQEQLGIGLSVTVDVSPSLSVGIGSTYSFIDDYKITTNGYSFERGDKFTLAGLTTARGLLTPLEELVFTVTDVKFDTFASWQVGEFDIIDSIASLQNSVRTRFPVSKNNVLLSFERSQTDNAADIIDFSTILLIFVNGVMQEPGVSYTYEGGTTFVFKAAPKKEDKIDIFFYRGTAGVDSVEQIVYPYLKPGDGVQIQQNPSVRSTRSQDPRVMSFIVSSDTFETGIYFGQGINQVTPKPIDLLPQKTDSVVGQIVRTKDRDSLESKIIPVGNIIKSVSASDNQIFLDEAQFFNYEENDFGQDIAQFNSIIVSNKEIVSAAMTAVVSSDGEITNILVSDGGSGYVGVANSVKLKFRNPPHGGTLPEVYGTVSAAGTITSPFDITNAGAGYTSTNIPEVIAPTENILTENIQNISLVQGFSGIITGITTTNGVNGHGMAIKFFVEYDQNISFTDLSTLYPIYVSETSVGSGVTSVDQNGTLNVSTGTTYCDNIYEIHNIVDLSLRAELVSNIHEDTIDPAGISTFGDVVGKFSWGRLSGITRSQTSPISIDLSDYNVSPGLSSFPSIHRRSTGLRNTGAIEKIFVS